MPRRDRSIRFPRSPIRGMPRIRIARNKESFGEIRITDSPTAQMETILAEGYTALFSDAEIEKLHLTADLPKELAAPVHRGERLGQAVLWLGEERLAAVDLLAAEDAEPFTLRERLLRLAEGWLSWRD